MFLLFSYSSWSKQTWRIHVFLISIFPDSFILYWGRFLCQFETSLASHVFFYREQNATTPLLDIKKNASQLGFWRQISRISSSGVYIMSTESRNVSNHGLLAVSNIKSPSAVLDASMDEKKTHCTPRRTREPCNCTCGRSYTKLH